MSSVFSYTFRFTPELVWGLVVAVVGVVATAVSTQGAVPPDDPKAWLIGVGTGIVRIVLGLVLTMLTTKEISVK